MHSFRRFFCTLIAICSLTSAFAEYTHPDIISFEDGTLSVEAGKGSKIKTSGQHFKHGSQSLCWKWNQSGAYIAIHQPIRYEKNKTVNTDNSIYSFVFWLYLEQPYVGSLRFEFLKEGRLCCWFDYGLDYSGWSGAWLGFKRDMEGKPEEGMDELRIVAPANLSKGCVFLDHIILSSLQDSRHHTADLQAPYINKGTNSHWLVLLRSWNADFDIPLTDEITPAILQDIEKVKARVDAQYVVKKVASLEDIRSRYRTYHLGGKQQGLPIFFERYGEAYEHWDRTTSYSAKIGEMGLSKANNLLLDMARRYRAIDDEVEKDELERMFVKLTRHMLDQGFRAGSALGTLHHLGYSMRNYYPAMFLMRESLEKAGLIDQVQQSMEWFSGVGEVKQKPQVAGMDIDAFNTSLEGRLMSVLLISDKKKQVRYLDAFARWVDNGYKLSDGLSGSFKPDGTVFHHCNHYPAYAVGGMKGAVDAVCYFHQTRWAVSPESHKNLKDALLAMRFYCNDQTWPLSLSGRHPDGKGHLIPSQYKNLSKCGTPDGLRKVDVELRDALKNKPQGARAFPYSCLLVQRRDDWMVSIKGHSRYIWNTETYEGCNLYGRYLNYGNIQVLATGNPIDNFSSGFRQEGWDWAHWPGTTAPALPVDSLRADINNLDNNSGYEEMLQSDRAFCNGVTLGSNGIWGMELHSHDKYDGSLFARKSVFCFDNRIICLGSDIRCANPAAVHTTLYQVALPAPADTVAPRYTYADGYGNYFIPADTTLSLHRRSGLQHSRHEETDAPTEGLFRMAAINHGVRPLAATYEYTILVKPHQVTASLHDSIIHSYSILQADSLAHILMDKASGTTGYVLWARNAAMCNSRPCLVMTQHQGEDIIMSVSDPDLHLYEGPSDETYLPNGKRKERIIYSYPWINKPSAVSIVQLSIPGNWKLADDDAKVKISNENNTSHLSITCQHGMAVQFRLTPQ